MKYLQKTKTVSISGGLALGLAFLACVPLAKGASSAYFTSAVAGGGTYYWDLPVWSVSGGTSSGPFNSSWTSCDFARFYGGGSASYTVVVSNSECIAGMYQNGSGTLTINAAGSGNLSIASGVQGFYSYGPVVINAPITGTGGVEPQYANGSPAVSLFGSNSYSGGTLLTSSSTLVYFNNSNSFGTGTISIDYVAGSYAPFLSTGGSAITLPNNFANTGTGGGINFANGASTPVISTGSWNVGTTTLQIRDNGNSTAPLTIAGPMTGSTGGAVVFSGVNGGTIHLSGTNTYTGATTVGVSGDATLTVEIASTGSLASTAITNYGSGAVLKLDGTNCLSTNASLYLVASPSAGAINLNFTGTQSIAGLYLGGVVQPGGTYGSTTSGATYQSATFTGNGVLSTPAAPSIVQAPESLHVFVNAINATFSVNAAGAQPLSYQWSFDGTNISGAIYSSYTIAPLAYSNSGVYSVLVTNSAGSNSASADLTVVATNAYTDAITGDNPISYWRLDETNGGVAYDVIGGNNGYYENVTLGQPGYSLTDTDTCIKVPGTGSLPITGSSNGFVIVSNYAPFTNFTGADTVFTLEAWAKFTNFGGTMRLFSTLQQNSPNGFAFGLGSSSQLKMTQGVVQDADANLTNALNTGEWYLFDLTCDGTYYNFYLNGVPVGSVLASAGDGIAAPLQFGCNPTNYFLPTVGGEGNSEQVQGYIDEVAIYGSTLSPTQVSNHFAARYSTLAPPVVSAPLASPPTNYVSLSSTLQSDAAGILLAYQWYQSPSNLLVGQTNSTLTLSPLALSNGGSYFVQVTNPAGSSNSPSVALTVLPIPTNEAQLNLTNSLVLHLPFDGNYNDASSLGNNGTNVGATTFVTGVVGTGALSYSSDPTGPSYNYVTLGVVPALQFGATTNFSVSFWVQQPAGSVYTNLPFFTDAIGSTSGTNGYAFAPYATNATTGGGWQWLVGDGTHYANSPSQYTSFNDINVINDGNWHNLVFVADRSGNLSTYVDGVQIDQEAISFVGNINNTNAATIGQDPTGAYAVTGQAYMDDLGVWTRTLSQLEVSGIYLAGASNSVSFGPSIAIAPVKLSIQKVSGQIQISWTGSGTLQAATNIVSSGSFTNVAGAVSPYTVPTPLGTQMYYRLQY